jgi:hypothetical protein|tara:strand:- start:1072 stop:1617 length:546 start_codon:yes stop_codon:yes gene_type:complete
MASPLRDRIRSGSSAVANIFGGAPATNVYAGLQDVAKKQYGMGADQLDRAKEAAETKATQQYARKRTHGGSSHAQSLSDIATQDITSRQDLANQSLGQMRSSRQGFESLAPELYKLAAAGGLGAASGKGLSGARVAGRPGTSAFAGGYTPGTGTGSRVALNTGTPDAAGANYRAAPRKYIL